jgi:hypothetical protein
MAKYADDEKDACELEKKILIAALKLKKKEYELKAKQALDNHDDLHYLIWDDKALAVYGKIEKVADMPCNKLNSFADGDGIDLQDLVRRYYPGMLEEQNMEEFKEDMKAFYDNMKQAIDIAMNFRERTGAIVDEWRNHINNLVNFEHNYGVQPDGSFITPWYEDPEKANSRMQGARAGIGAQVGDTRIAQVTAYEDAYFEYFKKVYEQEGAKVLCRYIHQLADWRQQQLHNIPADHSSQEYKDWSIRFVEFLTQGAAFRRIEDWQEIVQTCKEELGKTSST